MILLARHWEESQARCTRKRARLQCCRHEATVYSPSFSQKKMTRVSSPEIICPFLSTYVVKDVILRFNTDVKNHIRTHIRLTTCISQRSCILLFSTAESSFKNFCQQRHCCPSWSLTNVFFPSVPVIESAYNTSWHQLDCIIWDLFTVSHLQPWLHWKILLYINQENTLHESRIGYTGSYNPAGWLSRRCCLLPYIFIQQTLNENLCCTYIIYKTSVHICRAHFPPCYLAKHLSVTSSL